VLPMAGLAAMLLYQATNPAIYYSIALVVYFWGYCEGEVCYTLSDISILLIRDQTTVAKPWSML